MLPSRRHHSRMKPSPDPHLPRRGEPPHYGFRPVVTRAMAELMHAREQPKLLAVVAPVGYGKTVLMAEWHAHLVARGTRCYWTTLDERATRAEDVLQHLEDHSERRDRQFHPTQALFRGDASLDSRIEALIRMACERTEGFTAFIDNLHFCPDPQLGRLLERLVFDTPDTAHFVFSSTTALPLHLARAKLEGRVRQIGFAELSLDATGVADLLGARISALLGAQQLDAIVDQTEGWPAALRMMQLALEASPEPRRLLQAFSGSDEDLVALLNRQVLGTLAPPLREFLLAISSLHTFDAALCAHATGDRHAQAHLDWLVQHNVFMVPLDRSRTQYRLHGLFRQCLQAEARQQPDHDRHARQVLERAARWCQQHGASRDAMEYALAAEALPLAVQILDATATTFVRNHGDLPRYLAWAHTLLARGATLGLESEYWYVWGLVLNQRYDEGRQHLERLASRIRRAGRKQTRVREIERRLDVVRMCIAVFTDALDDAQAQATRWLDDSHADDPFDIAVARCIRSIHASSVHRFADARAASTAAQSAATQAHSPYAQGWVTALQQLPTILEGQYPRAYAPLQEALATLPALLGEDAAICGTLALLAAHCAVEMGQDDEARPLLERGLRSAHTHGSIDAVACGLDAAHKLWRDTDAHDTALHARLQQIARHYPPRMGLLMACQRIRCLLRLQRHADALAEAAMIGLHAPRELLAQWAHSPRTCDELLAAWIDLQVSSGHGRQALAPIVEALSRAQAEHRVPRQVDLGLMQVRVELAEHRSAPAARQLTRAIALAAPRCIVRPFRDLAPALAALIEDTRPSSWGFVDARERAFFADLCARIPMRDTRLQDRLVALNVAAPLLEPLTPRQVELLGLLEAGLSNQQLADRLDLTLTTIKGHLQRLFGKLGVSSRAAALARARVLKLL